MVRALFLALTLAAGSAALAAVGDPAQQLPDPALEERARGIGRELRCLVCQNQSIDDSDAPLARDLRGLVRERLQAGDSDAAVRDFVVARYGEFVLLRPVFDARTHMLWFTHVIVLSLGTLALALAMRRRRTAPVPALTPEERAALDGILGRDRG